VLRRDAGTLNWSRDISSLYGLAGDGKNIYVTDDKGAVQAFDRATGASVWKQDRLAERKIAGPQVIGTEFVAVVDVEGYVHLLASSNGAYVGRLATDGSAPTSQPGAVLASILFQTANGNLYAVTAK
jgi:outer membrane protein assembly factor BamB